MWFLLLEWLKWVCYDKVVLYLKPVCEVIYQLQVSWSGPLPPSHPQKQSSVLCKLFILKLCGLLQPFLGQSIVSSPSNLDIKLSVLLFHDSIISDNVLMDGKLKYIFFQSSQKHSKDLSFVGEKNPFSLFTEKAFTNNKYVWICQSHSAAGL